jgi:hypothetical protein
MQTMRRQGRRSMGEHESGTSRGHQLEREGREMLACAAMDGDAPGDAAVLGIAN